MAWGRRRSATLSPAEIERAWRRGLCAAVAGDWPVTETWLERIVEADSDDMDAYHALGRLYRQQGAIGRAIRMHQNLLLRVDLPRPLRAEAMFELARDFEEGGFSERAAATFQELLEEHPRHVEALRRVIPLLMEQREHARALALIRKLRRGSPDEAAHLEIEVLLSRAKSCADEGDLDGARQSVKRCLRRDKACARAWSMLGEIEAERGKTSRALDAWRRAALADPERARDLYPKLDASFAARGKGGEYESFLREILSRRPDDLIARIALARALASRGEAKAAIGELRVGVEVAPEDLQIRVELGRRLLASDQEGEALKAYSSLLEQIEGDGAGGEKTS